VSTAYLKLPSTVGNTAMIVPPSWLSAALSTCSPIANFDIENSLADCFKTTRCGHLDGRSMSRPQRKSCDVGHVRHRVEREVADLEVSIGGTVDCQTSTMDIFRIFLMISSKAT